MSETDDEATPARLFSVPHFVKWVLGLLSLLLLPSANMFTSLIDPKLDYGEFILNLPQRTLVIAKNSGTSTVNILKGNIEMQACRSLYETGGFEPVTRGIVPAGSYSIMITPRPASKDRSVGINDFESTVSTLSIMTPSDQLRFYFVSGVVMLMMVALTLLLAQWSFEDGQSHRPQEALGGNTTS